MTTFQIIAALALIISFLVPDKTGYLLGVVVIFLAEIINQLEKLNGSK